MRVPATVILVLLVVSSAGFITTTGGESDHSMAGIDDEIDHPDRPILVYDIFLRADGDATWNVTARFPIAEENEAASFDAVAAEYLEEDPDRFLPIGPFETVARELREPLDRSMVIGDVERDVVRTNQTGMLTLTFEWTGFADAGDNRVVVGDVFVATEHRWLSTLEADEYVRIHAPDGHTVESSGLPVQDRTMWARGPMDLGDTALQGTFVAGTSPDGADFTGGLPILGVVGAVLALLILAFAGAYLRRWPPAVDTVHRAALAFGGGGTETVEAEGTDDDTANEETADDPIGDPELLGDEELVTRLIANNGGRMKQATIVEETDWSNAKVSQLLSQMAEDGEVEKLRIGRENLITLPEEAADQ